jgi:DNA modification methylase
VFTTTLWEYPSQHYDVFEAPAGGGRGRLVSAMQGDRGYVGATPSWVVWQCLQRYTREGDTVVDPMCGSGTTLDVCADLGRKGVGFDLAPRRPDIRQADARKLPLPDASADFVFIDPPYSTHVDYSDDERCIGKLDAAGPDDGRAYYKAMDGVIAEIDRVLRPRRYMALYVSDSWRKREKGDPGQGTGVFMPIGFELFALLRRRFRPVDIVAVVRHNAKLEKGHWHKAAREGNYFMRGFNYLFLMKKE